MSIESLLTRLADALEANTEAMHAMMKTAGAKSTTGGSKSTGSKSTGSKSTGSKSKDKGPTVEEVAARVTAYLKAGDKDDRATAKDNVGRINEYFGADRFTAIDEDKLAEALDMLNDFEEGRTPEALAGDDNGDGDEEGSLV